MEVSNVSHERVYVLLLERTCRAGTRHLDALLVGGGGGVVLLLVELVAGGVKGTRGTVGEGVLAGDVALGLLLVGLLLGAGDGALDGLGNVVGGVLKDVVIGDRCMGWVEGWERTETELTAWPTMPSLGALALGADMLMVWWWGMFGLSVCLNWLMRVCVSKVRENKEGER